MDLQGQCECGKSSVLLQGVVDLKRVHPRKCDCEYCKINPSQVISGSDFVITISSVSGGFIQKRCGSGQAIFYHCVDCNQLVAVGAEISGGLRGALNGLLLEEKDQLGHTIQVQPRLLSPSEKIERWSSLWGRLIFESMEDA